MPKTYFEIEYRLFDLTADSDSTYTAVGADTSVSVISQLASDRDPTDYMMLEHNFSVLDGTKGYMPDDGTYPFCTTDLANSSGVFTTHPVITDTFSDNHTSAGVLIHFLNNFPYEVIVTWYDKDNVQIDQKTYHPDQLDYFCENLVTNFRKVKIEITKTNPYMRVKINRIEYGQTYVWDEDDVKDAKTTEDVDMLSDKLSANKLTMKFVDESNEFNISNQGGMHLLLQKGQTAKAFEYVDGERLFRGNWFFKQYSSAKYLTSMTLEDYIGIMDASDYLNGGIINGTLAGVLIEDIFSVCGIEDYTIDDATYNTPLYGGLKLMTCRKAMREVLFAADSIILSTENDGLVIKKRDRLAPILLPRSRKFSTTMQVNDYVSDVTVKYNEYEVEENASKLLEADYEAGTYTVQFNNPVVVSSLTITASVGTAVITEAAQLYATFTVSEAATVLIEGIKYKSTAASVTSSITDIEGGMVRKTKSFSGTLLNYTLAKEEADAILDYYSLRHSVKVSAMAGEHRCGDWIEIENPDETHGNFLAGMEKVTTDLSGGFIENATLVGYYKLETAYPYAGVNDSGGTVVDIYAGEEVTM